MIKLFGTDGVRGLANSDLTPELAFQLGRAAGSIFRVPGGRSNMLVGRDSRLSGTMLEGALTAGICSAGVDVYLAGVIPTPGVAYLTKKLACSAGAVISASHNPAADNGIKFFNSRGFKLADDLEEEIEKRIADGFCGLERPIAAELGRCIPQAEGAAEYVRFLKTTLDVRLTGQRIVLDCANGAASDMAPRLYREMGAQVICLHDLPDGNNINEHCGSTHPASLQEAVVKYGAQAGLAFDGDADRVIAVDEKGELVDGDKIIVICGLDLHKKEQLGNQIVVTVMSNLGLRQAFEKAGVNVWETNVGDRFVIEKMLEIDAVLGGEQSGHIIFSKHASTGDGLLTGLQLLGVLQQSGQSLSELSRQMVTLPQVLLNVRVQSKKGWEQNQRISEAIGEGEKKLNGRGRLLVRASGTETLIRVMAEGPDRTELDQLVRQIAGIITAEMA